MGLSGLLKSSCNELMPYDHLSTFKHGKYMLIEFQTHQFPKDFDQHLYDLKMSGVTPIIAHPERYKPVQNDIEIIEKLINSGCLIQIDAGSILGHFGKNCKVSAEIMLKRNMVHILGSDSHGTGIRNFCLKHELVFCFGQRRKHQKEQQVSLQPFSKSISW